MPYLTWREAIEALTSHVEGRTSLQLRIARATGLSLSHAVPRLVADARLQAAIARDLGLHRLPRFRGVRDGITTESQAARIHELRKRGEEPREIPRDAHEAEAWIQHLSLLRRMEAIKRLKINAGDIVETRTGLIVEVASIGEDGRIHFKGGRGSGSWPDLLRVRCRRDSRAPQSEALRLRARAEAAKRQASLEWSMRKAAELTEYRTQDWATDDDILQLEMVVNSAMDERPIQEFLARTPHVLTSLLGGVERYCIPKQRLGKHYVPDFLICHADSGGAHWVLVELETPTSPVTLESGDELDRHAREGLAQIHQWRRWLETNLPTARMSKRDDGLGLVDIGASARGLVLVGRRELLREGNERIRKTVAFEQRVDIHTYDWVIETLQSARSHAGPPGSNPHLIHGPTTPVEDLFK